MAYYLNLFSPQTYEAFNNSNQDTTGFKPRYRNAASEVKPGDIFICYMTKLSRWIGILEVLSEAYEDNSPIFLPEQDPFIIRFTVKPIVWLDKEEAIPIKEDYVWDNLTFTKGHQKNSSTWTGKLRGGVPKLDKSDALLIERMLLAQTKNHKQYPLDQKEYDKLITHRVRRLDKTVTVTVPTDSDEEADEFQPIPEVSEIRESLQIQGLLAKIGLQMRLQI